MCPARSIALVATVLASLSACMRDDGEEVSVTLPDERLATAVPLPGRHLDRSSPARGGVLSNVGPDGMPLRSGSVDPLVIEARRFYDTLQWPGAEPRPVDYPNPFTGVMEPERKTAPLTLEEWKAAFGFPARQAGEALADYRARAGIVVYYNKYELGLGRELGCSQFDDGGAGRGLACFVTNYGTTFGDERRALAMAVDGERPRNTVCISYRPSLGAGYEVQFYTYGADGTRLEYAQLDSMGPRPHPQVCINCHGGTYDSQRHLARNARFLPLDPNVVVFPTRPASLTRGGQEEPIRRMNLSAFMTPLTPLQREMIGQLYAGQPGVAGQVSVASWSPVAWQGSRADHDLFDKVVKPYCATCHMAIYTGEADRQVASYSLFESRAQLARFPLPAVLCGSFTMPNSQPTMMHFWETRPGPVTIGERSFASPADALLADFGGDRGGCAGLAEISRCDLAPDPDARCGDAFSGLACNRQTGRCVPDMMAAPDGAEGFCRMDGSRSCPRTLSCRPATSIQPGLESFDGVCTAE